MKKILLLFFSCLILFTASLTAYAAENGTTIQIHAVEGNVANKKIYNVTVPTSLAMVVYTSDEKPKVMMGFGGGVESSEHEGQGLLKFENGSIKIDNGNTSSMDLKITKATVEKNGLLWKIVDHNKIIENTDPYAYRLQLCLGQKWITPEVGGGGIENPDVLLEGPVVTSLQQTTYPPKETKVPVEAIVGGTNSSYSRELGKNAAEAFIIEWEITDMN